MLKKHILLVGPYIGYWIFARRPLTTCTIAYNAQSTPICNMAQQQSKLCITSCELFLYYFMQGALHDNKS